MTVSFGNENFVGLKNSIEMISNIFMILFLEIENGYSFVFPKTWKISFNRPNEILLRNSFPLECLCNNSTICGSCEI